MGLSVGGRLRTWAWDVTLLLGPSPPARATTRGELQPRRCAKYSARACQTAPTRMDQCAVENNLLASVTKRGGQHDWAFWQSCRDNQLRCY